MIYFRGCVARLKVKEIGDATETVLNAAGVNFEYLDEEECCGSVLLRTGYGEDAQKLMEKNIEKFKNQTILVSCGGCYRSLKMDYKEMIGAELDVIHTSQLFNELIVQGKIKLKNSREKIAYHDPCHLGRHLGEFEAPRNIIRKVGELVEMEHHHEKSRCCGSGGGVKSAYPELSGKIAREKIKEIEKTGPDLITTTCPFCKLNLSDHGLEVWDMSEFVVMFLEEDK
ncbi:MAG: (Fe-S)-binding protein [Euryarchaeota archaeon]|nr:(Fe-S)-binding protein [Euryarchaeota archaeon]MBV1728698.1 (Fe-S)-binding protein [Methanobacterium sp.]MBU4547874.1 (Fe-S)-binding protein [Euryarchaeota archaeon]MBU4608487.1 (Fe-S)-binding protein [Euryarchaeota archaeon]MBV1754553.1 (Fe-S)-binding protein [Methanobacterium sp.]